MLDSQSTEVKAALVKLNGPKNVDPLIASMCSIASSYFIKPSTSDEICDPAATEGATKNIPKFIHDLKSDKCVELWCNENKYLFILNLVK